MTTKTYAYEHVCSEETDIVENMNGRIMLMKI